MVSPTIGEVLSLPSATSKKIQRRSLLEELPDNLTSPRALHTMALKDLSKIKTYGEKEVKAKVKYLLQVEKNKQKLNKSSKLCEKSTKENIQNTKFRKCFSPYQ